MDKSKQVIQHPQTGAALLAFIVIILFSLTVLVFSLSRMGQFGQKISANDYRSQQAFEAAEAGLEFGIAYLGENSSTIIQDANADGYIDNFSNASTTNVTLSNGSKYTITYSNPTANDFDVIQITSVGTSADGSASREVRQQVKYKPFLANYSTYPFSVRGSISLAGSSQINNTEVNNTVRAGGSISISGGAKTVLSSGTSSTSSSLKSDVNQGNADLLSSSLESFFMDSFGAPSSSVVNSVDYYYQNSSNTNYNTALNGKQAASIWIQQTSGTQATIDSTTVVGSASNPVIIIVNGNLRLQGSAIIYGYIYVSGNVQTAGSAHVIGGMAVGGNVSDAGNFTLTYNSAVLNAAQQMMGSYGKIAGSWNDFKQ